MRKLDARLTSDGEVVCGIQNSTVARTNITVEFQKYGYTINPEPGTTTGKRLEIGIFLG